MPSVTSFQTNFSVGELSPLLFARVDISKYPNACYELVNFIVQRFGGVKKRGGTEYIAATKDTAGARLIPFVYSVTQAYILEFGNQYVRFYTNGGVVESGGNPVEVATPYSASEVNNLQFAQSADVLYLAHPAHPPMQLTREDATTFTLSEVAFEDGPYLELNESATTLTLADRASLTPIMTSNSAPSGTVSSNPVDANAYKVFDGDKSVHWSASAVSGEVSYDLAGSATAICDAYWLTAAEANADDAPLSWTVDGYDGSSWVTLDTRTGESGWTLNETRFYEFSNKIAFEAYRFKWSAQNEVSSSNTRIAEIGFNVAASSQTAFNLTASAVTGINDDQGFLATDVGRMIRLLGSDGKWRWAEIQAFTSSTVVTIKLHGHSLPSLMPIINWQMGAWSNETGYPACVGFYSGRLVYARTDYQPQTVWMSQVENFTDFGVSDPLVDDDAIDATIRSDSINEIKWIAEGTDLFVGTTAAIRTIGPTAATAAFSPTNIEQKRETNYGASDVQPVRVGQTAVYSGYYRSDIREISYSFESNGYVSQDLGILSEHIPALGVKQLAYAQNPAAVVWMVRDDNAVAGMTYERDQEVIAFHRHQIGGTDVAVKSVATIPGTSSDETWFIVNRTIDGSTASYIERLSIGLSQTGTLADATYLDSFLSYSGTSTATLTGLGHLEGEEVYVWNGTKQGPFTVSSGSITLTSAVTSAIVGLPYVSSLETLSPEAAAQRGTAQTREGRISEVFVRLNRSMYGKIGPSDGSLETLDYTKNTDNTGAYGTGTALFTGDVRVPIAMEWGRQKRIRLTHDEPTPFHCLGLISEIRVSG